MLLCSTFYSGSNSRPTLETIDVLNCDTTYTITSTVLHTLSYLKQKYTQMSTNFTILNEY